MASLLTRSTLIFALALASAAGQELPKKSSQSDFDPLALKLMLNDLPDVPIPGPETPPNASASRPLADVARLEAAFERAKKNAAFRERLGKSGVLSKLEVEQGQMQVVRLARDLANARFAAAKRDVEEQHQQPPRDDAAKKALTDAEASLTAAAAGVRDATNQWEQAQRSAAEIRIWRERKLLALGAGSKSAVKRAEAALQGLTASPAP